MGGELPKEVESEDGDEGGCGVGDRKYSFLEVKFSSYGRGKRKKIEKEKGRRKVKKKKISFKNIIS